MRVSAVLASMEHYLESILLSRSAGPLWQIDVSAVLGALQIVHHYHSIQLEPDKSDSKITASPEPLPKQNHVPASNAQPSVAQTVVPATLPGQSQDLAPMPPRGLLSAEDLIRGAICVAVKSVTSCSLLRNDIITVHLLVGALQPRQDCKFTSDASLSGLPFLSFLLLLECIASHPRSNLA